ncbi:MAG: hypothetical protein AAB792_00560 [Patescibacteria group bacterium]
MRKLKTFFLAFSAFFSSWLGVGVVLSFFRNFSPLEASRWSYIWPPVLFALFSSISFFLFWELVKRMRGAK